MGLYLGIDVGTSGTKTLLMTAGGKVLATATGEHEICAPRPGWSEQDPDNWWAATVQAVKAVLKKAGKSGKDVVGIGLSGQMHGLVLTDGAGKPLRSAIIWNDQRTAGEAAEIERTVGGKSELIDLVGNVAMTSFTLTKLLWVRKHEPKLYEKARHMLLPKDYIRLRLTGEYVGDVSDMSGTLMLDQRKRDWSKPLLSIFQIDSAILPPVVESHEISGRLTKDVAALLGLATGTPVVGGAGDQPAGAVGNGVVVDGLTSATMGTSGVVFVHSKDYKVDPAGRAQTFCSSVAGEYCMFGCVLAAGGSYQWFRNVLGEAEVAEARKKKVDPYELLTAKAAKAPAGCEGLFFLPYLTGERTPHADPNARACWVGIHSRTGRNELIRSVMEGATFAMNDVISVLRGRGLPIRQVRLSGGGARSAFWRQLQADIYGTTCTTINAAEGPAYGVALLAAVGTGAYRNVPEACQAAIKITRTIPPKAAAKKLYASYYTQYTKLYPALKDQFASIAQL
ncbi:MAG: xylulokinase [Planctomycetota bacterium]|nr:xylulokinase [Planctomycetota bacterium]